jgi:hypothetical protein
VDEMDRACSTHGEEEECLLNFRVKTRRKDTNRKTYT